MRAIILTQWFDPEPTIKGLPFARALTDRGFEVEVVTGFPNYPGGRLYSGYSIRPRTREINGDIIVTRLALYPSHSSSIVGRALNYLSFALTTLIYLLFFARRCDVIYCYHPPVTAGIAAAIASKIRRWPMVLDIQDLWPDTLSATGMIQHGRVQRIIGNLCLMLYDCCRKISVLSPGFKNKLIERGVDPHKIKVIYNWADEEKISLPEPDLIEHKKDKPFRILFAGNMGPAQNLSNVIDAAGEMQDDEAVEFCFLGGGISKAALEKLAADRGLSNVKFMPQVPINEVGAYLGAADALLIHLSDAPLFSITVPSKTQAYMYAGKPIIIACAGDAAELIRQARCGIAITPGDPEALAAAVRQLSNLDKRELLEMGRKGREFYEENLSCRHGYDEFANLLELAANGE